MSEWFKRHFVEGYAEKKRKQEEEEMKHEPRLSELPEYEPDSWIKSHMGYRMKRLASMLQKRIIGAVAAVLLLLAFGCLLLGYVNSEYVATAVEAVSNPLLHVIPSAVFVTLAVVVFAAFLLWLVGTALITLVYQRALRKYHKNGKVIMPSLTNYLNLRWFPKFFNAGEPEEEPNGIKILEEKLTGIKAKLAEAEIEFENPPKELEGEILTEGQRAAYKVLVKADIDKYKRTIERTQTYLDNNATIWSFEARDHSYIWKTRVAKKLVQDKVEEQEIRVLKKEVGWKIFLAVPAPSLTRCTTGWNEWPHDIGFETEMLYTMLFNATVDLGTHDETVDDDESDTKVVVGTPLWGVKDVPDQGLHFVWTAADGMLANKVLDIPESIALTAELDQANSMIAKLERRILDFETEGAIILLPEILQRLGLAGNVSKLGSITEPTTMPVVQPPPPPINHTVSKTTVSGWIVAGIIGVLSLLLRFL